MKKQRFILVFFIFLGFFAFGETGQQEEIDYLLFLPNSSNSFVNDDRAIIQLDYLANYLIERKLTSGQVFVYGYAATAVNDIEPLSLTRDRALFVINELQKRGVPNEVFADPVGYGEVDLWGGNTSEEERSPNRRVRILVDGAFLTPEILKASAPEIVTPSIVIAEKAPEPATTAPQACIKFPWILLLILLIFVLLAALLFFLSRRKKRSGGEAAQETVPSAPATDNEPEHDNSAKAVAEVIPEAAPVILPVVPVETRERFVNLDEEIRFRAYELYLERNGRNGDADGDWYRAVSDISSKYEADGYQIYTEAGSWWARKTFTVA